MEQTGYVRPRARPERPGGHHRKDAQRQSRHNRQWDLFGNLQSCLRDLWLGILASLPLLALFFWLLHSSLPVLERIGEFLEARVRTVFEPWTVTEELVAVLSGPKSYEFKALFLVIQAALRARNATSGGEEMLRLRAYDKLQNLVQHGQVKKTGKQYKGVRKGLLLLAENLKALRENGPSH